MSARKISPFQLSSSSGRGSRSIEIPKVTVAEFKYGTISYLEPQAIIRGAAASSLNWLTQGSKIEIRGGYLLFGATRQPGTGRISGLFTAHKWDGTEIVFRARGKKIEYYNTALSPADWTEVGTNILGSAAANDDVSFAEYISNAGAQLWISSPNSDLIKILTANPGSYVSQYTSAKNYKGYIKFGNSRMVLWNYLAAKGTWRDSKIDTQTYTTVTDEVIGTGDGTTTTFSNTLAAVTGFRTCFAIGSGTGNPETWTDNYLGTLTGSLGGTGTINYATGAISLTFNGAPGNGVQIKITYEWEDSTVGGVADFTFTSPTRKSGEGNFFLQNAGGAVLNSLTYNNQEYIIHEHNAWNLNTLPADDTTWSNTIYMNQLTSQNWRGSVATQSGIYYIDVTDKSRPFFGAIRYNAISQQVLPEDLSGGTGANPPKLDLTPYLFDKAAMFEWGKYVLCACRTKNSSANNRILLYNKNLNCFDFIDYYASCFAVSNGTLLAGDSATSNVFQLFSGYDDDGASPYCPWTGNIDFLGYTGLKTIKQIWIEGEIDPNQTLQVWASIDRGTFVLLGIISGNGKYVDKGSNIAIGQNPQGQYVVGGGMSGAASSNHYITDVGGRLKLGRFQQIQLQLIAIGVGYVSCSMLIYYDVWEKADKLQSRYRQ